VFYGTPLLVLEVSISRMGILEPRQSLSPMTVAPTFNPMFDRFSWAARHLRFTFVGLSPHPHGKLPYFYDPAA
jgi:hypothetical protein